MLASHVQRYELNDEYLDQRMIGQVASFHYKENIVDANILDKIKSNSLQITKDNV